jgi:hypothetical protein
MAVRIQFRRGTAAEWASANPTLATGELGYEVDTAQIKIGNGSSNWANLAYAAVSTTYVDNAIANVIGLAPEDLDTLSELAAAIGEDPNFSNSINAAVANAVSEHNTESTNVHGIADTADLETQAGAQSKANAAQSAAQSYADNAIANLIDSSPSTLNTLNELAAALGDDPNFATTIANSLGSKLSFIVDTQANLTAANAITVANTIYITPENPGYVRIGDGVTRYNNLDFVGQDYVNDQIDVHNGTTINVHGIANTANLVTQTQLTDALDNYSTTAETSNTITDAITNHAAVTLNVHGIANTANLVVQSSLDDLANTVSLKAPLESPTFTGTVVLPANTSIGTVSSDDIAYLANVSSDIQSQLDAKAPTANATFTGTISLPETTSIGNVSATELSYLNNASSNIQAQIDARLETSAASSTYAPLANATFNGTISLPETTSIGNVSSTEISYLNDVTSNIQTQLNAKAPTANATFTGTISLPSTTSIGDISSEEIGYLNNVSSNIQSQLDAKLATSSAASIYAPLTDPTFINSVVLPANTAIGSVSSTEIGYLDNVSSNIQSQLDAKAPTASPTFTGTVSGITASMVGLGNVDNTSDLNKPISNATQTALDAKLSLSGGTMTGKITLDADPTQALHAATKQYVDSVEAGLLTRPQVKAATTANLNSTYNNGTAGVGATLTATANGAFPLIDGVALTTVNGNRGLLVKNQTDAAENGRYNLTTQGDGSTPWVLTRCGLCDEADEIPGSYIFVTDGTLNGQTGWVQHVDDPATFTVGTDDIFVFQFAGAGTITAGTNISVNGNQVSVVADPTFANVVTVSAGVKFADNTIQTSAGVPSLTEFTEKTSSYTLDTLDHKDNVVEMNSSSPLTFTIPTNATLAWPVGASMDILQTGTGQVTIANAVGVTLNSTPGNKLRTRWSSCTIMKRGADSWIVYGDLTA